MPESVSRVWRREEPWPLREIKGLQAEFDAKCCRLIYDDRVLCNETISQTLGQVLLMDMDVPLLERRLQFNFPSQSVENSVVTENKTGKM